MKAIPPGALALFLDFDGTIVDIAPTPDAVAVPPGLPACLSRLRHRLGGALAIVSGRSIATIDGFLVGASLDVCGLHGLERRFGGVGEPLDLPDLSGEAKTLARRFATWPGVLIENKGRSVAIHWRLAPEAEDEARTAIEEIARRLGPAYRLQGGKAVREILPARAGKGAAIGAAMTRPPYAGRIPVFVGDDRTDEDGFQMALSLGGIAVKVGPGETAAALRVETPARLRSLLDMWGKTGFSPSDLALA